MPRKTTKLAIEGQELRLVHYFGPEDASYVLWGGSSVIADVDYYAPNPGTYRDDVVIKMAKRIIELEKEKKNDNYGTQGSLR